MPKEQRAQALASRRDELLARLPREIAAARSLAPSDRELVVDDAITFAALEHTDPLEQPGDLDNVFWAACAIRVKRTLDGRFNTVRGRFSRVSDDELDDVPGAHEPADVVEQREEQRLVTEFAATLDDRERRVLRVKYFSGTTEPLGYKKIAQTLRITEAAARSADRAIARRLEHFAAVYAAGDLCPTREVEIAALAAGTADPDQARVAQAHVAHCMHCHALYAEQLRAIRSAAFERKVAAILPVVEAQQPGRLRGAWDAIVDTAARPFAHDTATSVVSLAGSGAGRGAGTILVLKIASACAAGAGTLGVCLSTVVPDSSPPPRPPAVKPAPQPTERARAPVGKHTPVRGRSEQVEINRTRTPAAEPRRTERRSAARASSTPTQAAAANAAPATPAPPNAAPSGASEFDPTYVPSAPPAPAPAPPPPSTSGATEFF